MRHFWNLLTGMLLLPALAIGQSNCICGGFIAYQDHTEWYHNFQTFTLDTCDAKETCRTNCVNYLSSLTNSCDMTTIIPDVGASFGDYTCQIVGHDVSPGSHIIFKYQLCSGWTNTDLNCTSSFCCIDGNYPETSGCPLNVS